MRRTAAIEELGGAVAVDVDARRERWPDWDGKLYDTANPDARGDHGALRALSPLGQPGARRNARLGQGTKMTGSAHEKAKIELRNVRKSFGAVNVIHDLDLAIEGGEFVVFVGPSGCGKSTLLRMIAGLEDVTDGETS